MLRLPIRNALAAAALTAATFAGANLLAPAPAAAFGQGHGYGSRFDGPPPGWRPSPPAVHGYWGARRWRRYNDGYGWRPPPPPPSQGYGYGWR